jgi:hypothetical protein
MTFDAFEREIVGESASSSSPAPRAPRRRYRIRDLMAPLVATRNGTEPASAPSFADPLIGAVDGVLETPDRGAIAGRFFTYGAGSPDSMSEAMFVPADEKRNPWAIVVSEALLSPAGPWLGVSRGDLDGDRRSDLAFVSQGVDGCDRGPCPLFWLSLLLTNTPIAPPFSEALFLDTATLDGFGAQCSPSEDAFGHTLEYRWRTRVQPRGVVVSAASRDCHEEWTFTLGDSGRFERAPPAQDRSREPGHAAPSPGSPPS